MWLEFWTWATIPCKGKFIVQKPLTHHWTFPIESINDGICLGNGRFGVRLWGDGRNLRLTFGRADFWDRRSGVSFREGMSFERIRELLEKKDELELRRLFEVERPEAGQPRRPSVMPVGRLELCVPDGECWSHAELDFETTKVTVFPTGKKVAPVEIVLSRQVPVVAVRALEIERRWIPSWDLMREGLETISVREPQRFSEGGWFQALPSDAGVGVVPEEREASLRVAVVLADNAEVALQRAAEALREAPVDWSTFASQAEADWRTYWDSLPSVDIPNPTLSFHLRYGFFRLGGLTAPDGVAPTLQGPWIEDAGFPAWSSDYHWNINVQMCCWPMFPAGQAGMFEPLIRLLQEWTPRLRENARIFAGVPDGRLLPHATDDIGQAMGGFWSGLVDHGCTTWVATMLFDYWRHTGDITFLRDRAFPFMRGTMQVWETMLEQQADGSWKLPVSVSPEYKGNRPDAWGRDASFQLAAIHRLLRDLRSASEVLGETMEDRWVEIAKGLPLATVGTWKGPDTAVVGPKRELRPLALWEGQLLEESHRHHSHLAGIHPFDTLDLGDPDWLSVVDDTFKHLTFHGMGLWAGWALPWAAILHARVGNGATAEWLLELWNRVFVTSGHGQTHDASSLGFTLMGNASIGLKNKPPGPERMQMDQPMGAVAAILEMLMHERGGALRVFAAVPKSWPDVSFRGLHCAGGFIIDAERRHGKTTFIKVHATRAGELQVAEGSTPSKTISLRLDAGETRMLRPDT